MGNNSLAEGFCKEANFRNQSRRVSVLGRKELPFDKMGTAFRALATEGKDVRAWKARALEKKKGNLAPDEFGKNGQKKGERDFGGRQSFSSVEKVPQAPEGEGGQKKTPSKNHSSTEKGGGPPFLGDVYSA